jgi:uncharacterized protein HemX
MVEEKKKDELGIDIVPKNGTTRKKREKVFDESLKEVKDNGNKPIVENTEKNELMCALVKEKKKNQWMVFVLLVIVIGMGIAYYYDKQTMARVVQEYTKNCICTIKP